MTDTNQLPEPELGYIKTDKSNQPAFSARQMREAMKHALQARAQVQGEPVAWMHWSNGPVRVFMNKDVAMMELDRLNREYPLDADDRKMRPLIFGDTAPQPAQATQAEVTDGIRPEDFTVDVVVKPMGGFAPVNTQGVRVTHKPTGISVTCDAARSQHTNRNQAFETLRTILAPRPERVAMTDEPVAYMWQHDETGRTGFVEADQLAMGWRDANPRLAIVAPCYTHPAPGVPDDVARDAERYRWLRDNGVLGFSGAPSWRVSVSFDAMDAHAQTLDSNIDAAMLAAK